MAIEKVNAELIQTLRSTLHEIAKNDIIVECWARPEILEEGMIWSPNEGVTETEVRITISDT